MQKYIISLVSTSLLLISQVAIAQPKAVDLGLSVNWASCNVGASSPSENGSYFAWGEISPKSDYSWETYKWCNRDADHLTKYNTDRSSGIVDGKTHLDISDDAASQVLGGKWRMPTEEEFSELIIHCTWKRTTLNGVEGFEVTSHKNGNSIFLPYTGCRRGTKNSFHWSYGSYWSSSLDQRIPAGATLLYISQSVHGGGDYQRTVDGRYSGMTIRAVSEK